MSAAKCLYGIAWLATIAIVFRAWVDYEHTPGAVAGERLQWPTDSGLILDGQSGTLVMFLHPHCPCSRTGLRLLERILYQLPRRPTCYFLFAPMDPAENDVRRSENRRIAVSISATGTKTDDDAHEATCFDAKTSGYILYYDAAGQLRYRGGISAERGSDRTNAFEQALVEAIRSPRYPVVHSPVFGCPLTDAAPQ